MKKLSDFKALLFDIDRTLTDTKRDILPETRSALTELGKRGFKIGVCSGRGTASIRNKIFPLFPSDSFHITTGGSQLVDSTGKKIWSHSIEEQSIKNIREYLDTHHMTAVFMKSDAQYTKDPILSNLKKHPWIITAKDLKNMSDDEVGSIYIPNLNEGIMNLVKNDPNLSFKDMNDNFGNAYIDVTAKGVNKSIALQKWAEHTNIPVQKIIGFGDGLNDLEFLKTCGFGVAMGNASEELKRAADRVIGHTDENALGEYLTKIIKGENL